MRLVSRARGNQLDEPTNSGLEERISNMEAHLCIYSGTIVCKTALRVNTAVFCGMYVLKMHLFSSRFINNYF